MMDAISFSWQDPPPRKRQAGRDDWSLVVAELKSQPGRWAKVYESASTSVESKRAQSVARGIASANLTAFAPKGSFESAYRTEGSVARVYARAIDPTAPQPNQQETA